MIIGIMGDGFVGDALSYGIQHFKRNEKFYNYIKDVIIYDPYKRPESKLTDLFNCDMIFVCVPTPMGDQGKIDDSIVEKCLNDLSDMKYNGVVIIKSTVSPISILKFEKEFSSIKLLTNPEFLTERSARSDFINSEWITIGSNSGYHEILVEFYEKMYEENNIKPKIVIVDLEAAMMAKYMTNVWFAVKVSLMNEFHGIWSNINPNRNSWENVVEAFSSDTRVGQTHLEVPGPDGDKGWGGKCFPKDLNALIHIAKDNECVYNVMRAAWESNKIFRKNKNWLSIPGAVNALYQDEMD